MALSLRALPAVRLLPRGRSTNGEQEEESVQFLRPSVRQSVRPSVPHQMTPPPPTNFTVGFHASSKSQSFGPAVRRG